MLYFRHGLLIGREEKKERKSPFVFALRGSTSTNTFMSAAQTQIKAGLQYNDRWDFNCGKETKTIQKMHTSQCTENKPDIQDVHQIKFALACLTSRSVPRAVHTDCFRSGSSWKLLLSHPIFSVTFCHTNPTARPPSLQESALRSLFLLHSSSIFNILCRAHPQSLLYTCPNHLIFLTLKTAKLSSTELTK